MASRNTCMQVLFIGWLMQGVVATGCLAQDLLVFPRRIIFDGAKKKTETINLTNNGVDTSTYEVSFVEIRMRPDGSFENITHPDEGQHFASPHLKYFPRKVVLAPGESQTIKLQLAPVGRMEPGEYRSHLYFRSTPKPLATTMSGGSDVADNSAITIKLTPVYGITIPAIIRVGAQSGKALITDAVFEQSPHKTALLKLDFARSGSTSLYGDILVYHTSPSGRMIKVGEVTGFAVYTPTTLRTAKIALMATEGVDYSDGKLTINFVASDRKETIARTELLIR